MGQYKDSGHPAHALAEECAEVIQVITKCMRFGGNWDDVPPGQERTRWEMLEDELRDLVYQYERLIQYRQASQQDDDLGHYSECSEGTLHGPNEQCNCPDSSMMFE